MLKHEIEDVWEIKNIKYLLENTFSVKRAPETPTSHEMSSDKTKPDQQTYSPPQKRAGKQVFSNLIFNTDFILFSYW